MLIRQATSWLRLSIARNSARLESFPPEKSTPNLIILPYQKAFLKPADQLPKSTACLMQCTRKKSRAKRKRAAWWHTPSSVRKSAERTAFCLTREEQTAAQNGVQKVSLFVTIPLLFIHPASERSWTVIRGVHARERNKKVASYWKKGSSVVSIHAPLKFKLRNHRKAQVKTERVN